MSMSKEEIGGYNVVLVSMLPEKFRCGFCAKLMRDAIQTFRGERACDSCYNNARGGKLVCPIDGEPIQADQIFKDRHAQREILQLPCYCNNKPNGCPWEEVVHDAEKHFADCEYVYKSCGKCNDEVLLKYMVKHLQDVCKLRIVKCPYCEVAFDAQSLQGHQQACVKKPKDCPYNCGVTVTQNDLFEHVQRSCTKVNTGTVCPYNIMGCTYETNSSKEVERHLQESAFAHAALSIHITQSLADANNVLEKELRSEHVIRVELANELTSKENELKSLNTEVKKQRDRIWEIEKECADLKEKSEKRVLKLEDDMNERVKMDEGGSLTDINESMVLLHSQYDEYERKLRTGNVGASGANLGADSVEIRRDLNDYAAKIDMVETNNAVLSANLSDLDLKLQLLENTSYDGRQLWKIDNVRHRMQQAVTGKVTALHSAPCYTTRGGYKFCSRLYLNGDGMGKGTHVSLFFVVMRSEYDALLDWPFTHRVTFRLLNHDDARESIKETFLPDRNSSSFQKPTRDMNIAAGCPMFIQKERLFQGNFIVDDSLFIETKVTMA